MAPRKGYVRRNVNKNVEQEVPQVHIDPLAEQSTKDEFQAAFHALAHTMTSQANREVVAPMNPRVGTPATRVRDFTRMNPLEFHGSKVLEDPQDFIDEAYKIVGTMGITSVEKA
ncbi:hypothetical protein R3W88_034143 [Solanum pinnatisectum]|uniref:Gag-pol polyprotein n=1 Tax=Solanum pinnatisectum TaxID=50273 RepID=A0AAV9JZB1_9SOLN|nr:hypothetical protein R3W88_034143 [Solanum pinnatisectum]